MFPSGSPGRVSKIELFKAALPGLSLEARSRALKRLFLGLRKTPLMPSSRTFLVNKFLLVEIEEDGKGGVIEMMIMMSDNCVTVNNSCTN